MSDVYDPYRLYQNKGYSFLSDILAFNFKTSIDLENLFNLDLESYINKVNKSNKLKEMINLYFDFGFGLTYFQVFLEIYQVEITSTLTDTKMRKVALRK